MQEITDTVRQIVEFEDLVSRLDRINDVGRPLNNIGGAVIENKIGTIITTISPARTTTITTTLTKTTTTKTLSNWGNIGGSLPVSRSIVPELGSKSDTVPVPASTTASTSASASISVSPFLNKQESNSAPLSRHYVQDSNCSCTCSHIGTAVKSAIRTINCSSISEHRQKEEEIERQEQQEQRVRVHIGIDEDLRMILDMDPSIVDGMPTSSLVNANSRNNGHVAFARPLRSTRPQGWYRIIKTVRDLTDSRFFIFNFLSLLNQFFNSIIYIYIYSFPFFLSFFSLVRYLYIYIYIYYFSSL